MKRSFIWLVFVAFIMGLAVMALNMYEAAIQAGQAIEEKLK